jgi:hypothetical protein
MELMSAKRIRHLPVVENNVVLGHFDRGCSEVHHRNTKETIQHLDSLSVGQKHNYIWNYQSK